jgi:hypothetical protein
VVLLHVVAIRGLLGVRALFDQRVGERQDTITTWIVLPPETVPASLPKQTPSPAPAAALPMARLMDETASPVVPSRPIILPPRLTLPTLALPPPAPTASLDALVFSALRADFACNFVSYDTLPDAEKARCALHLSKLGDVPAQAFTYTDHQEMPFTIFGARGTFRLTPSAQNAFDPLEAAVGCKREQGLCRPPEPAKFGLDPDDTARFTAAAKFELAKGLSLDVGAQGYTQDYLAAGVVLTYRW